ncbi:MAG: hypothetical protein AAF804_04485 [Bacteroidota bacterium]
MQTWMDRLDAFFYKLEARLKLWPVGMMVGMLIYGLAMAYVSGEDFRPGPHGKQYMKISQAPFDFEASYEVSYRRLMPTLGYLIGLRGDRFLWLMALASMAIPASLYVHVRRAREFTPSGALGSSLLLGLSTLLTIHFIAQGYVDQGYYLAMLWAFLLVDRSYLSVLFMTLAPLIHEATLVLWPAWALLFFLAQRKAQTHPLLIGVGVLCPLIIWLGVRMALNQVVSAGFDFGFYFSEENLRVMLAQQLAFIPLAVFYTFKLGWLLPIQAIKLHLRGRNHWRVMALVLIFMGVSAQSLIAFDLGRLYSLAFPTVVLAMLDLYQQAEKKRVIDRRIWACFLLGLPLFTYYIAGYYVVPLLPWPLRSI